VSYFKDVRHFATGLASFQLAAYNALANAEASNGRLTKRRRNSAMQANSTALSSACSYFEPAGTKSRSKAR
jgi:hypothetical protein